MKCRAKLLLLLLATLALPSLAQDGPSARVNAYLELLPQAKTLLEVKPYFSKEFWDYTYAPLLELSEGEQAELLTETAESVRGFTVKKESVSGNKAKVTMADPKGVATDMPMVKENGVWVIDLEELHDDGELE